MNVLYIRTSTSEQTPELQLANINSICSSTDFIVYKEQDSAWAENVKRPEFEKILDLIKKGKVNNIYVFDLDRIYRNRKKLTGFFLLCKTFGTQIHSYNQQWLENINTIPAPFNEIVQDLMVSLMGWLSEEESSKKSSRVKMAVVRNAKGTFSHKGNKWGRKGFPKQTITRVLEMHELGKSIRTICNEIVVYDAKNGNEKKMSKSAVHKIIVENTREKERINDCPQIN